MSSTGVNNKSGIHSSPRDSTNASGNKNIRLDQKEEARKRLFQEFEVVFKRYVEALEFVNNRSKFSKYE